MSDPPAAKKSKDSSTITMLIDEFTLVVHRKQLSSVVSINGLQWQLKVTSCDKDALIGVDRLDALCFEYGHVSLHCMAHKESELWRAKANIKMVYTSVSGEETVTPQMSHTFSRCKPDSNLFTFAPLVRLTSNEATTVSVEIQVEIEGESNDVTETTPVIDLFKFTSLNEMSNVTLVIGEKKLSVSKDYLTIHSPVFGAMFFGNYSEKGKEEVEIKDVVYEEFLDLLHLIFPGVPLITDLTVLHVLKLADRFQMKGVMDQAEMHLINSSGIKNKLGIADQFRLAKLRDHWLKSFSKSEDMMQQFKASPDSANFSDELKVVIFNRLLEL